MGRAAGLIAIALALLAPAVAVAQRAPAEVFSPDERVQATNPAVAFLLVHTERLGDRLCSGAVIGPRVVLTAAHCLNQVAFSSSGYATSVDVEPGRQGASTGAVRAASLHVPAAWVQNGEPDSADYGALVFAQAFAVAPMRVYAAPGAVLRDPSLPVAIAGYDADKPLGTQWLRTRTSLYLAGEVLVYYHMSTFGGASGAPVYRPTDRVVFGVNTLGSNDGYTNVGRRITAEVLSFLDGVCAQAGCAYERVVEATPTPTPRPVATATPRPRPRVLVPHVVK